MSNADPIEKAGEAPKVEREFGQHAEIDASKAGPSDVLAQLSLRDEVGLEDDAAALLFALGLC